MLYILQDKLPPEEIERMTDICKNVFDGNGFDDIAFNAFIEKFAM